MKENREGSPEEIGPFELTPERRESARQSGEKYVQKVEAIKSATPADPETGEEGKFVDFIMTGEGLRPVYMTESGKVFLVPTKIKPYDPADRE